MNNNSSISGTVQAAAVHSASKLNDVAISEKTRMNIDNNQNRRNSNSTNDCNESQKQDIFRTKRSYIPVEINKRQQLIRAVEDQGLTIKEAAQNLKINYSTAKHIVKVFKRTGEVATQMISKRQPDRDIMSLEAANLNNYTNTRQGYHQTNDLVYQNFQQDPLFTNSQPQRISLNSGYQQVLHPNKQDSTHFIPQMNPFIHSTGPAFQNLHHIVQGDLRSDQQQMFPVYQNNYKRLKIGTDVFNSSIRPQIQQFGAINQNNNLVYSQQDLPMLKHQNGLSINNIYCGPQVDDTTKQQQIQINQNEQQSIALIQRETSGQAIAASTSIMKPVPINKNYIFQLIGGGNQLQYTSGGTQAINNLQQRNFQTAQFDPNHQYKIDQQRDVAGPPAIYSHFRQQNSHLLGNNLQKVFIVKNPSTSHQQKQPFSLQENLQNQQHAAALMNNPENLSFPQNMTQDTSQAQNEVLQSQNKYTKEFATNAQLNTQLSLKQQFPTLINISANTNTHNTTGVSQTLNLQNLNQYQLSGGQYQYLQRKPSQLIPLSNSLLSAEEQNRMQNRDLQQVVGIPYQSHHYDLDHHYQPNFIQAAAPSNIVNKRQQGSLCNQIRMNQSMLNF